MGNIITTVEEGVKEVPIVGDAVKTAESTVKLFEALLEIIGLLDDVFLMFAKIAKLLLSEIPKFVMMGVNQLKRLLPIISDLIDTIFDIFGRYKDTTILLGVLAPVLWLMSGLIGIIDFI